eukprot:TRINITY_DN12812_c0_g1::TRINITY_DN12812_c0_g1_i1::g.28692::m.28692 TRINITY_DN12812_c0_g1::TRINITY_DN12812_c0_g1_i1::g.28692  ORF type:complete len:144 (-),score=-4.18,IQ/PF00612.22/65,IQ/PF00612.22/6.2e-05 TRINITY_DN12812_c0_g1_i1:107-538(-)
MGANQAKETPEDPVHVTPTPELQIPQKNWIQHQQGNPALSASTVDLLQKVDLNDEYIQRVIRGKSITKLQALFRGYRTRKELSDDAIRELSAIMRLELSEEVSPPTSPKQTSPSEGSPLNGLNSSFHWSLFWNRRFRHFFFFF